MTKTVFIHAQKRSFLHFCIFWCELWTLITDERHVWLSYISGCRLGTYGSVLPPKIKLIGWLEPFLCTLKNWVFFAIFSMNFFWGKILEKPPYKVKIYAEPYRWWNFDRKILFQKVFWKKFVLQLKIAKFKKKHFSLVF